MALTRLYLEEREEFTLPAGRSGFEVVVMFWIIVRGRIGCRGGDGGRHRKKSPNGLTLFLTVQPSLTDSNHQQ